MSKNPLRHRISGFLLALLIVFEAAGTLPAGAVDLYIPDGIDGSNPNLEYYEAAASMISEYWEDDYFESLDYSGDYGACLIDGEWYLAASSFCDDAGVSYKQKGKKFIISSDEFSGSYRVNKSTATIDGEVKELENKPVKRNGQYYISASELEENYCYEVIESDEGVSVLRPYQLKRLIVETKKGKKISPKSYGAVKSVVNGNIYVLQFGTEKETKAACEKLSQTKKVLYAEPDRFISMIEPESSSGGMGTYGYYSDADWNVSMIGADALAERIQEAGITRSVTVAVVDTGIDYTHSYLSSSVISKGYDFINSDYDAYDDNGHGTHVAGIIVNTASGANVSLLPVKVLSGQGYGSSLAVANGITYAAQSGADVINLSLGGASTGSGHYEDNAISKAISLGSVVCVAAGNDSSNTAYFCPAHNDAPIVVAAIDSGYNRAYFSNYGNTVDVAAPGVDIYSTYPGNSYQYLSGTSMATPHVSGLAALIRLIRPSASNRSVESILRSCAKDLGTVGFDQYYGYGVPDVSELDIDGGNDGIYPTSVPTSQPVPTQPSWPTATPYPTQIIWDPWPTATPYPTQIIWDPWPTATPYPTQTIWPTTNPYPTQPVYSGNTSCSISSSSSYVNGVGTLNLTITTGAGVSSVVITLSNGKTYTYTSSGNGINQTLSLQGGVTATITAYDYYGNIVYSGNISG